MSIFDELKGKTGALKGKATQLIGQHGDKIHDGIEKAGSFADNKTGGKYASQVKGVQQKASGYVAQADRGNSADGTEGPHNDPEADNTGRP